MLMDTTSPHGSSLLLAHLMAHLMAQVIVSSWLRVIVHRGMPMLLHHLLMAILLIALWTWAIFMEWTNILEVFFKLSDKMHSQFSRSHENLYTLCWCKASADTCYKYKVVNRHCRNVKIKYLQKERRKTSGFFQESILAQLYC